MEADLGSEFMKNKTIHDILLETLRKESERLNKISKCRRLRKSESVDLVKYLKLSIEMKENKPKNSEDRPLRDLSDEELDRIMNSIKCS
jgi:hypothetical protein